MKVCGPILLALQMCEGCQFPVKTNMYYKGVVQYYWRYEGVRGCQFPVKSIMPCEGVWSNIIGVTKVSGGANFQ